ncbi:PAS domain-containing hybrid sensor histidine kinase/response regulator [Hymenobacter profundi]|uniref:histidine kinase n=1 Tax=Hymenobacter profundi TaxID=1982110 RepID=A0ABS6X0E5_9BACT|nr:ATP-binding protein [Hymenobacter profundi]MBW3128488.1 PAS domain-containing protein [Hymenobacter profundi]
MDTVLPPTPKQCAAYIAAEKTGRLRAEEALAAAEARIAALEQQLAATSSQFATLHTLTHVLEQNPNPILRVNVDDTLCWANRAGNTLLQAHNRLPQRLRALAASASEQPIQKLTVGERHYVLMVDGATPDETSVTYYLTDVTTILQAKQALLEQQLFYETILMEVPAGVVVFDVEHRYLFVNPTVEPDPARRQQMLGKTTRELCQMRQRPEEVIQQRERAFAEAIGNRRESVWEEHLLDHTTGKLQYWLRRSWAIMGPDGNVRMVVSSGLNITERKEAEEAAARQREFYESILNLLPVDVAVFDDQHRFLFTNPSSISDAQVRQQILGLTSDEYFNLRGRSMELAQERKERFQQALETRTDVLWEETIKIPAGNKRILRHLRPVINAVGDLQMVVGSGIDITARYAAEERQREAEAQVRAQEAFIRLIVDSLPSVIYVKNANNDVVFRNAAFDEMAARSQHMLPASQQTAVVKQQLRQIRKLGEQVLTSQKSLTTEMPLEMASGETCILQTYMHPLPQLGKEPELLIVSTDITALKKAQQEAEDNARAKEAFLSRMSHEIRTPLNGVLGMAALLEKTPLTSQQQEYLSTMQRAGQHLLALVNDVLDMAKITANHLELDQAAFSLDVLLEAVSQTVAPLAIEKGLQLIIQPLDCAPVPRLLGDAYRLRQVLLNLLGNAIKFTEQGSVQLRVTVLAENSTALTLRFWVTDTGIGIAPEQQEAIFGTFAQASLETSRRFGGTGLGLAISEQLVRYMGGTLLLSSLPNEGTTFSFVLSLPRAEDTTATNQPAEQPAAPGYPELHGVRVLLAEDNMVNQWLATVMLEHWGVLVYAVGNGLDALAQLQENDYNAAILDIQMPGLSGVEVTQAIRLCTNERRAGVPIIALTANAFEADRASYLAAGMNACLTKPFEEDDLCRLLVQLISEYPPLASTQPK